MAVEGLPLHHEGNVRHLAVVQEVRVCKKEQVSVDGSKQHRLFPAVDLFFCPIRSTVSESINEPTKKKKVDEVDRVRELRPPVYWETAALQSTM